MKIAALVLSVLGYGVVLSSDQGEYDHQACRATNVIPREYSPYAPQDTMPDECRNPLVEQYIEDWEAGLVDFNTIRPDDTIPADQQYCKTLDQDGNYIEAKDCKLENAVAGYLWKELSDAPVVIGITNGKVSDHDPHFHCQPECYYAVSGRARTLAQGEYQWMETGQYFYIPGNTLHNTPITEQEGFGVLYWFPNSACFKGFKYYWRKDVKNHPQALRVFDRVNVLRSIGMGLGSYGANEHIFKELRTKD